MAGAAKTLREELVHQSGEEFHTTSTTFLGFIIGPSGIEMEPHQTQSSHELVHSHSRNFRGFGIQELLPLLHKGLQFHHCPLTAMPSLSTHSAMVRWLEKPVPQGRPEMHRILDCHSLEQVQALEEV